MAIDTPDVSSDVPIDEAVAAAAATDLVVEPTPPDPVEPEPPPEPPAEHGNKGKPPWFMDRISELGQRSRQAEERAAAAEREAREAKELLARIQRGDQAGAPPQPAPYQPQPTGDADIDMRVAQKVYEQTVNQIVQRGRNAVGRQEFDEAAGLIVAIAGDRGAPDIVTAAIKADADNAHLLLHQLGKNPERLAELASMDRDQKIAEFVRMSMTAAAPKTEPSKAAPTKVSKAPAPAPVIEPSTKKAVDFLSPDGDKMDDNEWGKAWETRQAERRARRR